MSRFGDSIHRVGAIRVVPILDAHGRLGPRGALFPEPPSGGWAPVDQRHPELVRDGMWALPFGTFLIEARSARVLVDTGIGAGGAREFGFAGGGLMDGLAAAGLAPDGVDVVLLTHLHSDHVGGNVDAATGRAAFPRARYLTHRDGWEWSTTPARAAHPTIATQVLPLEALGVLDVLDGTEAEVAPGVVAFETPGHAPGHVSVRVTDEGEELLILADAAVHPAQLADPGLVYALDEDHEAAIATRRRLVARIAPGAGVACGHYPRPGIGTVTPSDGGLVWRAAANRPRAAGGR